MNKIIPGFRGSLVKRISAALAFVVGTSGGYFATEAFAQFNAGAQLQPNAVEHISGGSCYNNTVIDGGNAALYCEKPDSSGNLAFTCVPDAGSSCTMNMGALNLVGDGGPMFDISGVNGKNASGMTIPSLALGMHCETGEIQITAGTTADAGFKRTFLTHPVGCTLGYISGLVDAGFAQNISSTGLTLTSPTNITANTEFMCCGN